MMWSDSQLRAAKPLREDGSPSNDPSNSKFFTDPDRSVLWPCKMIFGPCLDPDCSSLHALVLFLVSLNRPPTYVWVSKGVSLIQEFWQKSFLLFSYLACLPHAHLILQVIPSFFYGSRPFSTVTMQDDFWPLSWSRLLQSACSCLVSCFFKPSSHLRLGLQRSLFHSRILTEFLSSFLVSCMLATCLPYSW